MASSGILSLDLSTVTGWCHGLPIEPWGGLTFGVWKLPAPVLPGRQIVAFENELLDAIDRFRPGLIVYEASLPPSRQSNTATAELLIGLSQMTEAAAYRHEVEVLKEYPGTVRAQVMGRGFGRMTKEEKVGGAVVRFLRGMNIETDDHNAADAILQWMYAARLRKRT